MIILVLLSFCFESMRLPLKFCHVVLLFDLIVIGCFDCKAQRRIVYNEMERNEDSLVIHEGILSTKKQRIIYKKKGKRIATIKLSKPVMIAQAVEEEEWGYFQFPTISKAIDGTLIVSWQMISDSHLSYGKKTIREFTPMESHDNGLTWQSQSKNYTSVRRGYNIWLKNGEYLEVNTPPAKDIRNFLFFPKPVYVNGNKYFYRYEDLPEELQGIYFYHIKSNGKSEILHSKLTDPELLRYSIDSLMPIVWWGNIRELSNQSLVAGVYPTFYQDESGSIQPNSVSFYLSNNHGISWETLGKIPFVYDGIADRIGDKSFDEPAFEILSDSTFLCVLRSGNCSPLYKSFSYDKGKTWTKAKPFTPNGVKPNLIRLNNGVIALVSGRPGIQIRFCLDGYGQIWTDPIDMIPFMNRDGSFIRDVSCGYASLIEKDDNSFYLVYSNFITKNNKGEYRKSIWCRTVQIVLR